MSASGMYCDKVSQLTRLAGHPNISEKRTKTTLSSLLSVGNHIHGLQNLFAASYCHQSPYTPDTQALTSDVWIFRMARDEKEGPVSLPVP